MRVRYQDGLILGAAQLSGDQTYFRAALERRSLSRDMYGIAWGLELSVETAAAGEATSAIVWLEPGVAYGGDGKPIIVRERTELSSLLGPLRTTSPSIPSWAVYLVYQEASQSGKQTFQYCGQAMDPTTAEGFRIAIEPLGAPAGAQDRGGARLAPESQLAAESDAQRSRVALGVVSFDLNVGNPAPTILRQAGSIALPRLEPAPTQAALDADVTLPPARAEYVGLVGAAIAHPRRWTESNGVEAFEPAIVLEPDSGIHLEQPTVVHADARVEGVLYASTAIVAEQFGLCMVFPVDLAAGVAANSLLNKAVAWSTAPGANGVIAAPKDDGSAIPLDLRSKVLGIAVLTDADRQVGASKQSTLRVVVSGPALATLTPSANTDIGDWLVLDDAGLLKPASSSTAGQLVAKVCGNKNAQNQVAVIVSLA